MYAGSPSLAESQIMRPLRKVWLAPSPSPAARSGQGLPLAAHASRKPGWTGTSQPEVALIVGDDVGAKAIAGVGEASGDGVEGSAVVGAGADMRVGGAVVAVGSAG